LLARGAVQRRMKKRGSARKSLERALAIFDGLGATLWADMARLELARIGGRTAAGGVLTPTERSIAQLVAMGKTNKEVAAQLFITPRTVEGHLTRIYAKLGVRSRAELAHRMSVPTG
jgi:DNA-binding CsgD family transcriptional regulator